MSPDRLNFNHVFYFHVVAEEGSISRAAKRLGVTKPTVSEQIRQLESALGVRLFHRTGGALELTDDGRSALGSTRRMFSAASSLVERFSGAPDHAVLRVGVASTVARAVAVDFFKPLFASDALRVVLRTWSAEALPRALLDGDVDLAVTDTVPLEPARRGLASESLLGTPVIGVTSATMRRAPGRVLLPIRGSALRRAADDYLAQLDRSALEIIGEADDVPTALALAEQLPCLAFVPEAGARRELFSHALRVVEMLPNLVSVVALFVERDRLLDRIHRAVKLLREAAEPAPEA